MDHHCDSTPRRLFKEVLVLTKMNVNNADLALDGDPITIRVCQEDRGDSLPTCSLVKRTATTGSITQER
jgi:hypothetical protein